MDMCGDDRMAVLLPHLGEFCYIIFYDYVFFCTSNCFGSSIDHNSAYKNGNRDINENLFIDVNRT